MKIEIDEGGVTVAADEIAPLLGLAPAEVRAKMRSGEITTMHEQGTGDDAGRFRVTFFYAGQRLRLTCAADGTVLSRVQNPVKPPPVRK
ncbi:hypothetical protein GE300_04220 [Rhodobacteraceae bacterium 2CG4]|uniref:Uncharacterized protein n=1 Tax=Halovulum marinum TaxID=2662447 RepID=A0A6L5YX62_9RHOB|nr:DUF6522 family protein [Halovulum marinum]MSU88827.1 hypothetical protein [Halovulum marinum]